MKSREPRHYWLRLSRATNNDPRSSLSMAYYQVGTCLNITLEQTVCGLFRLTRPRQAVSIYSGTSRSELSRTDADELHGCCPCITGSQTSMSKSNMLEIVYHKYHGDRAYQGRPAYSPGYVLWSLTYRYLRTVCVEAQRRELWQASR